MILRIILMIALSLGAAACGRQTAAEIKPFADASEVRLFVERGFEANGHALYSKKTGLLLSKAQQTEFEGLLASSPIPEERAACFLPHHFFRYYDRTGKLLGEIAVCFCCDGIQASGQSGIKLAQSQELDFDYNRLERLVQTWGERTDFACDPE